MSPTPPSWLQIVSADQHSVSQVGARSPRLMPAPQGFSLLPCLACPSSRPCLAAFLSTGNNSPPFLSPELLSPLLALMEADGRPSYCVLHSLDTAMGSALEFLWNPFLWTLLSSQAQRKQKELHRGWVGALVWSRVCETKPTQEHRASGYCLTLALLCRESSLPRRFNKLNNFFFLKPV